MAQNNSATDRLKLDRMYELKAGKVPERVLPALPVRLVYRPIPAVPSMEKVGEEIIFRFRIAQGADQKNLDSFSMRDGFLEASTPGEALSFLALCGPFRDRNVRGEWAPMTWTDFQGWQKIIREIRTKGPLPIKHVKVPPNTIKRRFVVAQELIHLLSDLTPEEHDAIMMSPSRLLIRRDETAVLGQRPRLVVEIAVGTILEAVLAAVFIDNLRGADYRLCALPDCPNDFEITSKHEREYCSQECAHKASVRRRRAKLNAQALNSSKINPVSGTKKYRR